MREETFAVLARFRAQRNLPESLAPVAVHAYPLASPLGGYRLMLSDEEYVSTARGQPKRFASLDACQRFLVRIGERVRVVFVLDVQVGDYSDWEDE